MPLNSDQATAMVTAMKPARATSGSSAARTWRRATRSAAPAWRSRV